MAAEASVSVFGRRYSCVPSRVFSLRRSSNPALRRSSNPSLCRSSNASTSMLGMLGKRSSTEGSVGRRTSLAALRAARDSMLRVTAAPVSRATDLLSRGAV